MRAVMEGRMQMREVKCRRMDLLEKITANRVTHIEEFNEAAAGYKKAALDAIDRATGKLKKQIEQLESGETLVLASIHFNLDVPKNHSKDYDQVIAMLEMSVDEELTIKSDEFACYVMDDWDWKDAFRTTVSNYK